MTKGLSLDKFYQYLLIFLAFLMPLTVSGANTVIVIICFIWLFSGDYKLKLTQIIGSKVLIASLIFFALHVVGLIWTEDLLWGLEIVHKMWYFGLLFPIFYTIVKEPYIKYYLFAFILAIAFTATLSFLVWFGILDPEHGFFGLLKADNASHPNIFMSHISYNPILTIAIYLLLHEIFFNVNLMKLKFFLYSFFSVVFSINMFITGGRAGQIMFFSMIAILIFQFFNNEKIKALIVVSILIPGIFFTAYQTSSIFEARVNSVISDITIFSDNQYTSTGLRITFAVNSWEIIKKNPFIGVGSGDFPAEYKKVNLINTPSLPNATNPHNMYVLILVQLGLIGLVSLLSIFYFQIKQSFLNKNRLRRDLGLALPLLFLVIMFSDSYLLGHYTTLMYIFFSSFLYKNFEKN